MLEGDWLGGFAQPGVILNKVSAMSARFDTDNGGIVDEYGSSSVQIVRRDRDRIQLVKRYAEHEFVYVGRLAHGALAGYWYSPIRPTFAGVFWLSRVDRLPDTTAAALRDRVRATSPRRWIVSAASSLVMCAFGLGLVVSPPLALAAGATGAACVWLVRRRLLALRREVDLWREQLG
jgi:hypothetical protein